MSAQRAAIIIGATSGIGRELAVILSRYGYTVGVAGRRIHLLDQLKTELPGAVITSQIDLADQASALARFHELIRQLGRVDLVVISSGTGYNNPNLDWPMEQETIAVNVAGFTAVATAAMQHFLANGSGHLVGISSIAALRGNQDAPAYNASKAYMSNYLEGMRKKAALSRAAITVTDIKPGFVDTPMAKGDGLFWVASPQTAARQIFTAIRKKKTHAYITRRWRLIAWVMKLLPDFLYDRI